MNHKKVEKMAFEVRRKFEQGSIDREELAEIYDIYNKVRNVGGFVNIGVKQFPSLNCGLASIYLQKILGGEVINGSYKNINHTFLLVDGNVVDITSDQYGGPEVYTGPLIEPWSMKGEGK